MAIKKPVGAITRGTTNPNRLRRVDRFIAKLPQLKASNPIVVDLGFGATPTTSIEMLQRLAQTNPQVTVIGIEIDRFGRI
jgi:tRNA G46 methylase TrmB